MSARLRAYALRRDGERCVYCGAGEDLTLDHLVPASFGGALRRSNVVTACASCNHARGNGPLPPVREDCPTDVAGMFEREAERVRRKLEAKVLDAREEVAIAKSAGLAALCRGARVGASPSSRP